MSCPIFELDSLSGRLSRAPCAGGVFCKVECFATLKLLFVYLTLGVPAGVIGIPYSLLVGNVNRLYPIAMWIANAGVRAAGIRIEVSGLENVPAGKTLHLHVQSRLRSLDPPVVLPMIQGEAPCS